MDEQEIEKRTALLHERRAKLLELLRAEPVLTPQDQAAIVYTLGIEPGIREHMPAIAAEAMRPLIDELRDRAWTCQCADCIARRAQA